MSGTILIIEDERDIADLVAARLQSEGFQTEICLDGESGVERCESLRPDLVILDVMLPKIDGIEVCRRIQQRRRTPVVMLTAKAEETDMLVGLGVGADDYVTKPFSPRELVARVHAILRRVNRHDTDDSSIIVGDLSIDQGRRIAVRPGKEPHLTATEFDLLVALASTAGQVLSREQLLYRVWGYRDGSGARTVDSHVRALRRKLGKDVIRTVHGVGYALNLTDNGRP